MRWAVIITSVMCSVYKAILCVYMAKWLRWATEWRRRHHQFVSVDHEREKCWGVSLRSKQNLLPPSLHHLCLVLFFSFFLSFEKSLSKTHHTPHSLFLFINRSFVLDRKKRNGSARARSRGLVFPHASSSLVRLVVVVLTVHYRTILLLLLLLLLLHSAYTLQVVSQSD